LQAILWPVVVRGFIKQWMQQLAHGLELQMGFTLQPHAGARRHLAPKAAELRQRLFLLAHVGQARRGHDSSSGSWLATNEGQGQTRHPPCSVS
jgi:hypothetical protein